jgi:hypothetical protein
VAVVAIAVATSRSSTSYGGRAPLPPGVSQPAAPYPGPHGDQPTIVGLANE